MTTLAINKLWSFLQSLPLTASNERWLAERLLESANAKSRKKNNAAASCEWEKYEVSQEIMNLALKNRKMVSESIDASLHSALEDKYR